MAVVSWPPPTPPNSRTNDTVSFDNHPSDHNRAADALDTIIARLETCTRRIAGVYLTSSPGQSGIGTAVVDITGATVTFTADPAKRYRATVAVSLQLNTAGWAQIYLCRPDNSVLMDAVQSQIAGGYAGIGYTYESPPGVLTGSVTLKLRAQVQAGTAAINQGPTAPTLFVVDEVGA